MSRELPGAVLFACSQNAIRSPIAAALMRHLYGSKVRVQSVGLRAGDGDPFAAAVMDEIGIDMSTHRPQDFEAIGDETFDLVVSLSPEAHHRALEFTRTMAVDAEYWPTQDPSAVEGSREQILDAYREVRDGLMKRIRGRFGSLGAPGV
ncbi:MAG TPA: arsenate reductase ArsC [Aestuariivirgaceae bacterium]|nr:arsenate reductase ArsC [Aestuariivirgaceae bacterium]